MTRSFASWCLSTDVFGKLMRTYSLILVPCNSNSILRRFCHYYDGTLISSTSSKNVNICSQKRPTLTQKREATIKYFHLTANINIVFYTYICTQKPIITCINCPLERPIINNIVSYIVTFTSTYGQYLEETMQVDYLKYSTKVCNYKA